MTNLPWELDFDFVSGLSWRFDPADNRIRATLTNRGDAPMTPGTVTLRVKPNLPLVGGWAWLHGRYMQMDALVRNFAEPQPEGYSGHFMHEAGAVRTYVSHEMAVLHLPACPAPALLVGCARMDRFFCDIEFDVDLAEERLLELRVTFALEATVLAPGESLDLPPIIIREGSDATALAHAYAAAAGSEMSARVPGHVPTGWCSWYYFYGAVTDDEILTNLTAMKDQAHPAEYVQIDDGYQSCTGDWLQPNEKFPSGMAALASNIRESGYRPGLWLAPFLLHEESSALREHPVMALTGTSGEVLFVDTWLGRCAVLDCTNPEAQTWLRDVVRTVVREWGYEYLKLDALAYAAQPGDRVRYHAAGTTAPVNLRRGLEIIREEAGDSTFILGCTCHFGPAIGLVDAMRVGPDVKETWSDGTKPSVKHALRMALQRNWMHNNWFANDPDCLVVRDTETSLNEAEVRFLVTGIALSGGMVVASDHLAKLSEARRNLALALVPPAGVAADPVRPSEGPAPSSWRVTLGEGRGLVGILNWDDAPRWVVIAEHLRPGEIAFDIFNGRLLGKGDILLRPHEGTLWQVTGAGPTPRVVGDTGHIYYHALFQRPVSGRIQVRNDLPRSRTLAIEARGQVFEVELAPGEVRWFD